MSSVATQFLYRNLVLDIPSDTAAFEKERNAVEAVLMSDGLRFVKTLKVGLIKGKMVALFDRLISRLQDHSLVDFEWDAVGPPLNSQLLYIWDHQWSIQSGDFTNITNAVQTVQLCEGLRFPQKYAHLSLILPLKKSLSKRIDLTHMTALTVISEGGGRFCLPSCISANTIHITNLQLHYVFFSAFSAPNLELDQITSLVTLGIHRCAGSGSILSKFKNPKLKHFHIEFWFDFEVETFGEDCEWMDEHFEAQFSFIRSFRGLETLAINVPDQRHPATFLKNLVL